MESSAHAHTLGIGENKFRGRVLMDPGTQRPGSVVQVENGRHAHQVHVGFVIGVERADIAPVQSVFAIFVDEIVGEDAMLGNDARENVFAEVVTRLGVFGIGQQNRDHQVGIENVDAHGGAAMPGMVRGFLGSWRVFLRKPAMRQSLSVSITPNCRAASSTGIWMVATVTSAPESDMLFKHAAVIHFIDVIAGQNENVFGAFAADGIDVLVHGVGGALIPLLGDAHLRGKNFDVFAEPGERRPARANMAIEAEGFVLGENKNPAQIGIDAVGKGDVDDAVESAEGHGRLGAVARQRPQAFALTAGEKDSDGVAHIGHGLTPGDVFTSG